MQAEGTALHTCLQLRSLFSFSSVVYGSPKDSLCPVELSLGQVCAVLEAEGYTPSPVSPRAEPRAGRGRMWNVEAQGVSEALWKSGGRKISSVKGAREREPSSSKEDLARKAQMT